MVPFAIISDVFFYRTTEACKGRLNLHLFVLC